MDLMLSVIILEKVLFVISHDCCYLASARSAWGSINI